MEVKKVNEENFMRYIVAKLDKYDSLLQMILKCVDKEGRFETELDRLVETIYEKQVAKGKGKVTPPPTFTAKNVTVGVEPTFKELPTTQEQMLDKPEATPQEVLDFNPENIEWEEFESRRGKTTWRHPYQGQPISASADYKGLRQAIINCGNRFFNHGEYYYFLSDDGGTIFRQKSQRRNQ